MTVNAYVVTKLRDVLVAEQVGKKAALGYFDVEFTLYGCAYYSKEDDIVRYKISSNATDIYSFTEKAQQRDIYASNVETITLKCPVPLGEKETIELKVKRRLAKQLQDHYPKAFFVELAKLADEVQTNSAAQILWEIVDEIEGHFSEVQIAQLEELIHYSYSCRKLNLEEYNKLMRWVQQECENMMDSMVSKDIYEKVIMGIAYEEDGAVKYAQNAQPDYVLRKAETLEQNGIVVTPVFRKQYFYNYKFRLVDAVKLFKDELRNRYTITYLAELKQLRSSGFQREDIISKGISFCETEYCENTLKRYATRWCDCSAIE